MKAKDEMDIPQKTITITGIWMDKKQQREWDSQQWARTEHWVEALPPMSVYTAELYTIKAGAFSWRDW